MREAFILLAVSQLALLVSVVYLRRHCEASDQLRIRTCTPITPIAVGSVVLLHAKQPFTRDQYAQFSAHLDDLSTRTGLKFALIDGSVNVVATGAPR